MLLQAHDEESVSEAAGLAERLTGATDAIRPFALQVMVPSGETEDQMEERIARSAQVPAPHTLTLRGPFL